MTTKRAFPLNFQVLQFPAKFNKVKKSRPEPTVTLPVFKGCCLCCPSSVSLTLTHPGTPCSVTKPTLERVIVPVILETSVVCADFLQNFRCKVSKPGNRISYKTVNTTVEETIWECCPGYTQTDDGQCDGETRATRRRLDWSPACSALRAAVRERPL